MATTYSTLYLRTETDQPSQIYVDPHANCVSVHIGETSIQLWHTGNPREAADWLEALSLKVAFAAAGAGRNRQLDSDESDTSPSACPDCGRISEACLCVPSDWQRTP